VIRRVAIVAAACALAAAPRAARADEVGDLINVIERQPAGMDRITWKEKRRDAAKKLGASGDPRAVTALIEVVETETFDIIGEIAIDALAELGDPAAIPVLAAVAADPARDTAQRDKAERALARLGTAPGRATGEPEPRLVDPGRGPPRSDDRAAGPRWDDDVLAASEELTFAAGAASLSWDSVRRRTTFDLDVAGHFRRSVDRERSAIVYGADAAVLGATRNPEGRQVSRLVGAVAAAHGELRGYARSGIYGVVFGTARLEATRLTYVDDDDPGQDNFDRWYALDLQLALGGGWGRVLDVGTRLRVARIASALERGRALGRPIDDELARRLQSAWWTTRGDLGGHRRLTTTVRILRDAGVLLGEPDAGTTYELLQILDDPQLDGRASGIDVQLAFGEGLLERWRFPAEERPGPAEGLADGRVESLLIRARFARQLGDTSDVGAEVHGRYRVLAPDDPPTPSPWSLGARGRWRTFVYGDHFDPTGALDVAAQLVVSDDDLAATDLGVRLGGELGWTWIVSRASTVRVAAAATVDAGELFVGARLEAAYGLLDGAYARSSTSPP
jgi:hypothetical protein